MNISKTHTTNASLKTFMIVIAIISVMLLSIPAKADLLSYQKSATLFVVNVGDNTDCGLDTAANYSFSQTDKSTASVTFVKINNPTNPPGSGLTAGACVRQPPTNSYIDMGSSQIVTSISIFNTANNGVTVTVWGSNTTNANYQSLGSVVLDSGVGAWKPINVTPGTVPYRYIAFSHNSASSLNLGISEIDVYGNPPPTLSNFYNNKTGNSSANVTANIHDTVNFNATSDQPITTWAWYYDGVNQSVNFNNITFLGFASGNHTLFVNATNGNGTSNNFTWYINATEYNPATSGFDPSGYVKNATGYGIPGAYVNISNSSYVTSTYSDANGFWNVNIGADGNYNYLVSRQGYTALTGAQAFTIGGVNNNFTMTASGVALLKGTVYTYAQNVPSTKVIDGSLTDLQHIDEDSDTIVGQYKKFNFTHESYTGYAIRMADVSSAGGRSVLIRVYHMDNTCGFQCVRNDLPEVGDSPYVMFEGDTVLIPVHVSAFFDANIYMHVSNIFIGTETSKINGNFGMQTTLTGIGRIVRIIDFVLAVFNTDPIMRGAIMAFDIGTFFSTHDNSDPATVEIDTTKCKTVSGTDGACILASEFDSSTKYLSFQSTVVGQSTDAGFSGVVIFGFSDDDATNFPDANQQEITLDSTMSAHDSNVINASSVDVNANNKIKVWLKIPSGHADTIAINYFYVTFIGGQTPLVPLPGVQVRQSNQNSTLTLSPMGTYSFYVPFGTYNITYSKNNYFPNITTLTFSASANVITNDVILNATNTTINQSVESVYVAPDPSTFTQQISAYFTTKDKTCLGFGYVLEVRQHGTDQILQTIAIPRLTTSVTPLNTFNPGVYDILMKGYTTCPSFSRSIVAQSNFTVLSNTPSVHWSSSRYVLGQTMQVQIGVPVGGGSKNVTVVAPNGTIIFNQNFAESNQFYTQTFVTNSNRTLNSFPPGLYLANITNGNTAQAFLSNVSTDDYSLSVPDSVGYSQVFNVVYVSPESADLIFSNSDGTYISVVPNIIGNNIVQFDTGLLPKRDTVLTIKIVRDNQIKASATTSVSISFPGSPDNVDAVAVIDGWTALFNLGINPTSKFLFALIVTVVFMFAGALVTRNLGWGTLFGIIPFVFFAFIGYFPLIIDVLVVIAIGLKLRFM